MLAEAGMVVVHVPMRKIRPRAQVRGRGGGPMFEYVEGPCIVLDGVAWALLALPEFLDGVAYRAQRDVVVGVNATQPTDEIAQVKIEKKEQGREAIRSG